MNDMSWLQTEVIDPVTDKLYESMTNKGGQSPPTY